MKHTQRLREKGGACSLSEVWGGARSRSESRQRDSRNETGVHARLVCCGKLRERLECERVWFGVWGARQPGRIEFSV